MPLYVPPTLRQTADIFYVDEFGAKGDNSTDDTTAIQSTIDTALAQSAGGEVWFGPKIYKFSNLTLNVPTNKSLRLRGQGTRATTLQQITGSTGNGLQFLDTVGATNYYGHLYIEGMRIIGVSTSSCGIYAQCTDSVFRNLWINQFGTHGLHIQATAVSSAIYNSIEDCISIANGQGAVSGDGFRLEVDSGGLKACNNNTFLRCRANNNAVGAGFSVNGKAADAGACSQNTFIGCAPESNNYGYYIHGKDTTIIGGTCETNLTKDIYVSALSKYTCIIGPNLENSDIDIDSTDLRGTVINNESGTVLGNLNVGSVPATAAAAGDIVSTGDINVGGGRLVTKSFYIVNPGADSSGNMIFESFTTSPNYVFRAPFAGSIMALTASNMLTCSSWTTGSITFTPTEDSLTRGPVVTVGSTQNGLRTVTQAKDTSGSTFSAGTALRVHALTTTGFNCTGDWIVSLTMEY